MKKTFSRFWYHAPIFLLMIWCNYLNNLFSNLSFCEDSSKVLVLCYLGWMSASGVSVLALCSGSKHSL